MLDRLGELVICVQGWELVGSLEVVRDYLEGLDLELDYNAISSFISGSGIGSFDSDLSSSSSAKSNLGFLDASDESTPL